MKFKLIIVQKPAINSNSIILSHKIYIINIYKNIEKKAKDKLGFYVLKNQLISKSKNLWHKKVFK
jgi:hypothetical protein